MPRLNSGRSPPAPPARFLGHSFSHRAACRRTRQDARARAAEQAKWKQITKSMKHHPKADRWR
jgi:hypothetical protein